MKEKNRIVSIRDTFVRLGFLKEQAKNKEVSKEDLIKRIQEVISHELESSDMDSEKIKYLVDIREKLIKKETKFGVSPDTWVKVAGGFALAILILGFERRDIITTKAFVIGQKLMGF